MIGVGDKVEASPVGEVRSEQKKFMELIPLLS